MAYWNLYDAYWTLYSREQALRQAFEAWRINKSRFEAGQVADSGSGPVARPVRIVPRPAHHGHRAGAGKRTAVARLLGLKIEDGTRLMPIDQPTLAPYVPDWCAALVETENLRPELSWPVRN